MVTEKTSNDSTFQRGDQVKYIPCDVAEATRPAVFFGFVTRPGPYVDTYYCRFWEPTDKPEVIKVGKSELININCGRLMLYKKIPDELMQKVMRLLENNLVEKLYELEAKQAAADLEK